MRGEARTVPPMPNLMVNRFSRNMIETPTRWRRKREGARALWAGVVVMEALSRRGRVLLR
jgi:hypothetical protein